MIGRSYKALFGILAAAMMLGCSVQFESDVLQSASSCGETGVSYNEQIAPLLRRNCYSCHSDATHEINGSSIDLEGYADLAVYATSGTLLGAVKHEQGFQPMPRLGNKLSPCSIQKIEIWINEGIQDN